MTDNEHRFRNRAGVTTLPGYIRPLYEVSHRLWNGFNFLVSWVLAILTSVVAFVFFFVLNRTVVRGRRNLRVEKNTLYLSNHQTMIDSFLIGTILTLPRMIGRPSLIPHHPAASENFFGNPLLAWFSARWKCIPVRRGQRDFAALSLMTETLREGTMLIYPEGTRSRTGEIGTGRPGTGKLIHDTGAVCIPIRVRGMDRVLPIGRRVPRIFQRIEVIIGEPVALESVRELPSSRETSEAVIARVMDSLRNL
ncbi:1-acyl-sn-glycerol-3-phosphate acyltransferase [Myxococcota bacterium]|nr:1-acyl-sn-glycerol-3-phosphate acyltransferase [Myxococcota bacterium]